MHPEFRVWMVWTQASWLEAWRRVEIPGSANVKAQVGFQGRFDQRHGVRLGILVTILWCQRAATKHEAK
jgi:hypothetical protein